MKQPSKHLSELSYYLSKNYTYIQIAKELGISRERVRQLCLKYFGQSMSKRRHLSPEEKQAKLNHILNMLEQGYSFKDIAQKYDVRVSNITEFLRIYGGIRANRGLDEILVNKIYEMRKTGATYKEIVDELGVNKGTINKYLKRYPDLTLNPMKGIPKITQEQRQEIRVLFEQGKSKLEIAHILQISVSIINKNIPRCKPITKGKRVPKNTPETIQKCMELRKQGYPLRIIAEQLGISISSVWVYTKNIPKNTCKFS